MSKRLKGRVTIKREKLAGLLPRFWLMGYTKGRADERASAAPRPSDRPPVDLGWRQTYTAGFEEGVSEQQIRCGQHA